MTDIGELNVRIKADASQLQSEMSKVSGTVKQSSSEMTSALSEVKSMLGEFGIALSVGALVEFTKSSLEAADNLYIMGQRIGFASSTLSALNIPLKQNGSSIDEFSSAIKFMSRNLEEVTPNALKSFNNIGLSITKLRQLSPEDQFYAIASALGTVHDQSQLTADVMAIFGRQGAALIPIIKEMGGNLKDFAANAKAAGDALTDEQIEKVHKYEDAWISFIEHLKIGVVDLTTNIGKMFDALVNPPNAGGGPWTGGPRYHVDGFNDGLPNAPVAPSASTYTSPGYMPGQQQEPTGYAQFDSNGALKQPSLWTSDLNTNPSPAGKGNNNDLANAGAATKAQVNEVQTYIQSLKDEAAALDHSKLSLEMYKAEKEAASKALTDYNNGLRSSKDLTDEEKASIDQSIVAYEQRKDAMDKIKKAEEEEIHMQAQLKAEISSALAQGIMDYKNFGSAVKSVLSQIVKQIIEMQITTPLVNSVSGLFGGMNLFGGSSLPWQAAGNVNPAGGFYADGGSPPVGIPSMVGENGPELFVPNQAGTIIPNNKLNGGSVTVQNTFILQPGLSETVNAAVMRSAPTIIQASHDSVMQALQKGGGDSKIARLRA